MNVPMSLRTGHYLWGGGEMFFLAPVGGKNFAEPTIKKSTKRSFTQPQISVKK
jgi:hypothetical protein